MPISFDADARRTHPESARAGLANTLVQDLQHRLVQRLESVSDPLDDAGFRPVDWLRDQGTHGGGRRYTTTDSPVFNGASINVSTVHYDDLPNKRLRSATALSTIIHPHNPHASSMHMHISWTELRDGKNYWRLMADLNPSLPAAEPKQRFETMLKECTGEHFEAGKAQGERYFYIPALKRHRGVSHYYLEGYRTDDFQADERFARSFGEAVIDCYAQILKDALNAHPEPTEEDYSQQLAYHTVYFFQVLTLDRGTTSGLLVHDQNDVGILASLPSFVDRGLLQSWRSRMESPQDELLDKLVAALPDKSPCPVSDEIRKQLADVVREHYRAYPEALKMQASGGVIPATVQNHGDDQ